MEGVNKLTLNAPIATKVVCFSRLLNCLRSLYGKKCGPRSGAVSGFYTKLNVWGSLGLNFDYDGGPIIENGGPIFLYKHRILGGSKSFREGIRTGLSCQTGVAKHQVIFASQPFVAT